MTVAELIRALSAVENQDQRVVVNGYEGGYCDVNSVQALELVLNIHKESFYGPHETVQGAKMEGLKFNKSEKVPAIYLGKH